ncbi:putative cyclin-dependent serine/threonine-protein kinase DDB_G0272797/DDB_G0274007 [Wyeomyia smithii]|uniref:putative cyclin-dependent serine/threonine-protein kinase DDB_G0272797/DDB_G0274007 n=1 Tax=Wyeomyia smithii TaxID=174621 RepID=UPI002467C58F|nr:putative cyclin-dependent serine/threonine-protein kinase DDB_G0272797/DDB_G0274007 [Wyeomyia smithii]
MRRVKIWKLTNLLAFLSTYLIFNPAIGSLIDNAIEQQHRVINEMNQNFTDLEKASEKLIDLGTVIAPHKVPPKTVKITNTVAVKVPVPYPVKVPIPVPVPIPVNKPIPVPVPKIINVPEPTPALPTVSTPLSYSVTSSQSPTAVGPTASSFSSRSSGPTEPAHFIPGEQETAYSHNEEQVKEFTHSYPIHSVFDVGVDYNPYMGNRLSVKKEATAASEQHFRKHSDFEQLREYHSHDVKQSDNIGYQSVQSYPTEQRIREPPEEYHKYYQSTAQPEHGSSVGQDYHNVYTTPEPEVVPHAYKSSKSVYFSKNSEKYPAPKFPRPTHSAYPTNPTYYTKQHSHEEEPNYENQDYKDYREYQHRSPSTEHRLQTVRDSYPHYEQPDFRKYHYQKPSTDNYREIYSEQTQHKPEKYYEKPAEITYTTRYQQVEHDDAEETRRPSTHYKQYEYQKESYPEQASPSEQHEQHEQHSEHYERPNPESQYSHVETREPQHYTPQEYKTYYTKPSPVSEALTYLEEKERSRGTDHKDYYTNKLENYRARTAHHEHKAQYATKPSAITYDFPSDSHLHPSYSEAQSAKYRTQHYYSSNPDQPSFDEASESEHRHYQHHQSEHSPSPSPSTHVNSYGHAVTTNSDRYREHYYPQPSHYQQHHHPHRHTDIASDMLESSSKDHAAYERAVEHDHQVANPNEYAEYTHEHLHHHHHSPPATDGRDY